MTKSLAGKHVAVLATHGFEQVELTQPWKALEEAGVEVDLVSTESGEIQGMHHLDKGETFAVDKHVSAANPAEYDALVLPGGLANPDALRMDEGAVGFVRAFFEQSKPVAAICHAPWLLVEAGVIEGRTLTSWPSLKTDVENGGGRWVDEEVHVDRGLVTSRKPDDLDAFCAKMLEEIAEGTHAGQSA